MLAFKICTKCKVLYWDVYKEFGKGKKTKDGLNYWCKKCATKENKVSKAKYKAQVNKPFVFNKTCPKCNITYGNAYESFYKKAASFSGLMEYCKKCSSDIRLKHRKDRPDLKRARNARRRSKKLQATAPWADNAAIAAIYTRAAELTASTGEPWHVDHIDPLQSSLVCGLHVAENLQVLPASVNCSKSNKFRPYRYCFLTNATYYLDIIE